MWKFFSKGIPIRHFFSKENTRTCQLNQHIKSIHEGKTSHACTVCYKTFAQSSYLKYHIKNVLQFVANLIRSSDLKHHIKTLHTGEKSHMCTFCNKSFTKSCRPASRTMWSVHLTEDMEQSAKDRKDSQGAVSDRQGPGGRSDARGGLTISGDSPLRDGEKQERREDWKCST